MACDGAALPHQQRSESEYYKVFDGRICIFKIMKRIKHFDWVCFSERAREKLYVINYILVYIFIDMPEYLVFV